MSLPRKNPLKKHGEQDLKENIYLLNQWNEENIELLLNATPLTSDQTEQQPSMSTCFFDAANYIRQRHRKSQKISLDKDAPENLFEQARDDLKEIEWACRFLKQLFQYYGSQHPQKGVIDVIKLSDHIYPFSISSFTEEQNNYFQSVTEKHFKLFINYLISKVETLPNYSAFTRYIDDYLLETSVKIEKSTLIDRLHLNFEKEAELFFHARKVKGDVTKELKKFDLEKLGHITLGIFYEQFAKSNQLSFLNKHACSSLKDFLPVIRDLGPMMCAFPHKIFDFQNKKLVKPSKEFIFYDLPVIKDQIIEAPFHVLIIVGGKLSSSEDYLYMIDPNDGYNRKTKSSVYRIEYHAIENYLTAFDKGLFIPEKDKAIPHSLAINYFIYGKNSLKPSRDFDDSSLEDEISSPLLKKHKK
jgi:hypothetical protein